LLPRTKDGRAGAISRQPGRRITPCCAPADITERRDLHDNIDRTLAAEPIDAIDAKEPIDPMERNEPTEPMDRADPFEAIDRNEPSDHSDK
jgi:hypothetical protein